MARKFYTVFILPHAQERFRKLHVSKSFLVGLVSILGVVLVAGAVSPHLAFKMHAQSTNIASLEEENKRLRDEKVQFESSLAQMGEQIDAIEHLAGKLASAVGLRDLPSIRAARGGGARSLTVGGPQSYLDEELGALRQRTESLDRSFGELRQAWEKRLRVLASTPSLQPVAGPFSDGFGWRKDPFTGEREFHRGIDIVAPLGTEVRAAADGLVTAAGRMNGYGKVIHLSHGFGHGTRYGHLSEISVRPGTRVHRGDVIGRVGSTGRSSGPHLHYEVFVGGRAVDPRKYLGEALF